MILHALIVDDEEDVLESPLPGFVRELAEALKSSRAFQEANERAGFPFPSSQPLNIKVSALGYQSTRVPKYKHHSPVHLHLHLCCEKGGSFRHALRLLKEQFFAVVVSDMRFSEDSLGSRAGRFFVEDIVRRNPELTGILYSAYHRPDDFPPENFVRKGSASNLGGVELLEKMVAGFARYLAHPSINTLTRELHQRGLVYQSDEFGSMLRRAYDYSRLYLDIAEDDQNKRRHPRPTILLDGETGTGKTELTGLMHAISTRRSMPFVSATCNQLTDEQFLRSVLFGHVKGAFSGATTDRPGLVETAGKGVLLLDDLHKLSDGSSVILHSFLDDGEYSHLGQDEIRRSAHCAIVATVETPRWQEIKVKGDLAESFINRVEQLIIRIPPLAARPIDIQHQARYYCDLLSRAIGEEMEISDAAIAWLVDYGFPGGNSRKLRDFLKGVITQSARVTDYIDLPEIEEFAQESRLLVRPDKDRTLPAPLSQNAETTSPVEDSSWKVLEDRSSWTGRIARLAVSALAGELRISGADAEKLTRKFFESDFQRLWKEFESIAHPTGLERAIDIKLFDELFRYYVVFQTGNPAKAAKQLGMKDNALREFIYSREQKREGTGSDAEE